MDKKTALMITEDIARAIDDVRLRIDISDNSKDIERLSKSVLQLSIAQEKMLSIVIQFNQLNEHKKGWDAEFVKKFAKFCISKSVNGVIYSDDIPEYVIEFLGGSDGPY